MAADQSAFETRAEATLRRFAEQIEDALDAVDVEFNNGILTLMLADGGQYVLNKHGPNRQIWMSSPISGAWHFDHDEARGWVATRGGRALAEMLAGELEQATGSAVALD